MRLPSGELRNGQTPERQNRGDQPLFVLLYQYIHVCMHSSMHLYIYI